MKILAPLIFSMSTRAGDLICGVNENPIIQQPTQALFAAIENRDVTAFDASFNRLKELSSEFKALNIKTLRSERGFNLIQELSFAIKKEANEYVDWPSLMVEPHGYYTKAQQKKSNAEFLKSALAKIQVELNVLPSEYIMQGISADTPFMFLAGTDSSMSAALIYSLIDSATPEQKAKLKDLAPRALYAAVTEGSAETISTIIQRLNVDPNMCTDQGETLLEVACKKSTQDHYEIEKDYFSQIEALLNNGADPRSVDLSSLELKERVKNLIADAQSNLDQLDVGKIRLV